MEQQAFNLGDTLYYLQDNKIETCIVTGLARKLITGKQSPKVSGNDFGTMKVEDIVILDRNWKIENRPTRYFLVGGLAAKKYYTTVDSLLEDLRDEFEGNDKEESEDDDE